MTTGTSQGRIGDAGEAWQTVRGDQSIQFAPLTPPVQKPREPGWLETLFGWLGDLFEPVGRALGLGWPVFKWILLAVGVAAAGLLAWRMIAPALGWRPPGRPAAPEDWTPAADEAFALLEDADRLAGEGRFDEACHLLLIRSVRHIAEARPELVDPATTARELATHRALPEAARAAFAVIAARVERSLFALRALGADDWHAARGAYAQFALASLAGRAA